MSHLDKIGIDFAQFSFRWFNCLMLREFPLCYAERIWDTYVAEGEHGFNDFHKYVCAAFLCRLSSKLQTLDFQVYFIIDSSHLGCFFTASKSADKGMGVSRH